MIVLTLGTFDLLHAGHVRLLERCRALAGAGRVVVGLNTDGFVERYKGAPPVIAYTDREACLSALRYVDAVIPNDQADGSAWEVIDAVGPDIIAVGSDWRDRDYLGQLGIDQADLDANHTTVFYLPYTPGAAGPSSEIKRRIAGTTALEPAGETR